jgi:hypothetical protein
VDDWEKPTGHVNPVPVEFRVAFEGRAKHDEPER